MQKLGKSKKEGSRLHRDWETEGLRSQTTDLGVCPEGSGQSRKGKGVVGGGKVTLALSYPVTCHQQPISLLCLVALFVPEICQGYSQPQGLCTGFSLCLER